MSDDLLIPVPMRAPGTLSQPGFTMPAGACDAHVHVFEADARYPRVAKPHYELPDGTLAQLDAMTKALSLDRFVVVQPSYYGTDNACLLDALERAGERARGVAMVDDDVSDAELGRLHELGVRALRLDLFLRAGRPIGELVAYIQDSIERTRALGWHVQFYTPGRVVRDLVPYLGDLDADFVIDHMGYMLEADGLTRGDFDRLLQACAAGRGWIKLSGPYRVAKDGNFARLKPLAQAIVAALPERVIWGSDWPHIPEGDRDTGELLALLHDWVPDEAARNRILVDNPRRLFGF